jgi:hypothetical protein
MSGSTVVFHGEPRTSSFDTTSGRKRPLVRWDHPNQRVFLPDGVVAYDSIRVRLTMTKLNTFARSISPVSAILARTLHDKIFGFEAQLSVNVEPWKLFYQGQHAEEIIANLQHNGITNVQGPGFESLPPNLTTTTSTMYRTR